MENYLLLIVFTLLMLSAVERKLNSFGVLFIRDHALHLELNPLQSICLNHNFESGFRYCERGFSPQNEVIPIYIMTPKRVDFHSCTFI